MAIASPASHSPTKVPTLLRVFHLWHLLSLDAPAVATLWTWFIACSIHLTLPASSLLSMFLAVWMLYAADRILDARQLFHDPLHTRDLEARHLFHHRYAKSFLTAILAASLTLAVLLPHLLPEALRLYTILGALLFAWFLLIHSRISSNRRLPKEVAVGIFFPAAIFIPTVARHPELRLALLPYALLFGAVCILNCLSIYDWEHATTPYTNAHWTTFIAVQHLSSLYVATAALGFVLTFLSHSDLWPISLAASVSAVNLLALHLRHRRISPITLRAAADLALLTPIFTLPFLPR